MAVEPGKGEITVLLGKWKDGESAAFEELMPLVYPHLREVAAAECEVSHHHNTPAPARRMME